ncbi:MAG TPA: sigma-70 family RNA polymerase sigma factor [Pirellulaceae bacterium]|nr:sigma-70 family RNA polymerase sigma factor [Pirellulaceae bacterium]
MTDTDQLLDQAQAGNVAAVDQLLERHRPRLRRLVSFRLDPRLSARVDPSDVVQETLHDASRRLTAYLSTRPLPFFLWLREIASDRLADLHRRHLGAQARTVLREEARAGSGPSSAALLERFMASGTNPLRRLVREELQARVQAALAGLADEDRDILLMRHSEQLRVGEIAALLDITERAAKSRIRRALERLRQQLPGEEQTS